MGEGDMDGMTIQVGMGDIDGLVDIDCMVDIDGEGDGGYSKLFETGRVL